MYECPNCGGNMLFDIVSQHLKCDQCHTLADPYTFKADDDDGASSTYDVNIFTCPQCGGEIMGSETSAAEFCSFCGASTILTSRVSHEQRPDYLIPFTVTKDDCKKAYSKYAGKAFFAPKELRKADYINEFRGIYTPYWAYYFTQDGEAAVDAQSVSTSGNYTITRYYKIFYKVDAYYKGLTKDASSSFYDNISESIAPYDVKGMKEFKPTLLSGFYADIADVPSDTYYGQLQDFINDTARDKIKKAAGGYSITNIKDVQIPSKCNAVNSAMFPVWFMSYRNGDRIAYATVNGQTGKVCADLPVSKAKYFLFSILTALPLFLIFNITLTVIPKTTLVFSSLIALLSIFIFNSELKEICKRELFLDDLGTKHKRVKGATAEKLRKFISKQTLHPAVSTIITAVVMLLIYSFFVGISKTFTALIILVVAIIFTASNSAKRKALREGDVHGTLPTGSIIAVIAAFVILFLDPVSDIFYYGGSILSFAGIIITILQIITKYNILSTRRLPQFDRKGGDDRA